MIVGALAVLVVAAFAILGQGQGSDQARIQPEEISLDKSLGADDAPVVVVEYGDFQ
jgi:protein-disulfide isomerase